MASFDPEPKNSDPPPLPAPANRDPFDALFEPPSGNLSAGLGDFTQLFGKPPTPEPLPGIGEANTPEAVSAAKLVEVPGHETAVPLAATSAQGIPVPPDSIASREVESAKPRSNTVSPDAGPPSDIEPSFIPPKADLPSPAQPPRGASEFTLLFGNSAREPAGEVVAAPSMSRHLRPMRTRNPNSGRDRSRKCLALRRDRLRNLPRGHWPHRKRKLFLNLLPPKSSRTSSIFRYAIAPPARR